MSSELPHHNPMENILSAADLEELIDRVAKRAAKEALSSIGLHDQEAVKDLTELRGLLTTWRDTRKAIWAQAIKMATTATLGFIMLAIYFYASGRMEK